MKLTVRNVDKKVLEDGRVVWCVRYDVTERSNGEMPTFYHHFMDDQIDYYMAAYGTEDIQEVLDLILADPFHEEDPGPALLQSSSRSQEGATHRARCARVKLKVRLSSRGVENPLEMIRGSYRTNPERTARGEEAFREARREYRRMNNG